MKEKEYIRELPRKKSSVSIKKVVLIGLGVLAGLIVAWAVGLWIFCLLTFSTYENEKDGVALAYPKTWKIKERPMTDVIVAFISPKENSLDTFFENVNISTYDMSNLPHSTDDYARIMIDQLLMSFSDIKLLRKTVFPIAGEKGYRMVLKIIGDDPKVVVVYAFTLGTTGYNMLYIGSEERFFKDRMMIDLMALSYKVRYDE